MLSEQAGGSIDRMIAASNTNLAATTDETIIIPGHGKPVSNKAELKEAGLRGRVIIGGRLAVASEQRADFRR